MALFVAARQLDGPGRSSPGAEDVVCADGRRGSGGRGGAARSVAARWSRPDEAGDVRLHQDVLPDPRPRNQLFVAFLRRGRTAAVVIEAASAVATRAQWVFRNANGRLIAELATGDVSHIETAREGPATR